MGRRYPKRTRLKYAKQRYRVRNWREYETGLRVARAREGEEGNHVVFRVESMDGGVTLRYLNVSP